MDLGEARILLQKLMAVGRTIDEGKLESLGVLIRYGHLLKKRVL